MNNREELGRGDIILVVSATVMVFCPTVLLFGFFIGWWFALAVVSTIFIVASLIVRILTAPINGVKEHNE